jgi:hypothetical protein
MFDQSSGKDIKGNSAYSWHAFSREKDMVKSTD